MERPVPEAPLGTLPQDFPPLAGFNGVTWMPWLRGVYCVLAYVAGFAALAGTGIALGKVAPGINGHVSGFLIFLPVSAVATVLGFWVGRRLCNLHLRQLGERDRRTAEASDPEATLVGVAFCDGVWGYRGWTSWDHGFLTIDHGQVNFTGSVCRYSLPASLITDLVIGSTRTFFIESEMWVFVEWRGAGGESNIAGLQPLGITGSHLRREAAARLADSIEATRSLALAQPNQGPLPLASSKIDYPFDGNNCQSLWADRVPMYIAMGALIIGLVVIENVVERALKTDILHFLFLIFALAVVGIASSRMVFARVRRRTNRTGNAPAQVQ